MGCKLADVDAIIYARISSDRTGDELGVTRQQDEARRLAEWRGLTVVEVYIDNDLSASGRAKRPGFDAMLADLDAGRAKIVIAWDITRITRNARDTLRLLETGEKMGVTVAMVKGADLNLGSADGRMVAEILATIAKGEISKKSERQKAANAQAVAQGRWVGGRRPFGFENDGVTVRETEAAAIKAAYDAVLAGVPVGRIAKKWNDAGLITGKAKLKGEGLSSWRAQTVGVVLCNPRYAGLRTHLPQDALETMKNRRHERIARIVGPAQWPALVSEETWRAVVEVLTDPDRRNPARSGQAMLTGVARCGLCDATIHLGGSGRPGRPRHQAYRCSGSGGHVVRASAPVDEYIGEVVIARLSRPDAVSLLADDNRPNAGELDREARALRSRIDGLATLLAEDVLTADGVRRESAKLRRKLAEVQERMTDAGRVNTLGPLIGADDVRAVWDAMDTDRRRLVVSTLMSIRLMPPGRGVRVFNPASVVIDWTPSTV